MNIVCVEWMAHFGSRTPFVSGWQLVTGVINRRDQRLIKINACFVHARALYQARLEWRHSLLLWMDFSQGIFTLLSEQRKLRADGWENQLFMLGCYSWYQRSEIQIDLGKHNRNPRQNPWERNKSASTWSCIDSNSCLYMNRLNYSHFPGLIPEKSVCGCSNICILNRARLITNKHSKQIWVVSSYIRQRNITG